MSSKASMLNLAERITAYWAERGYAVKAEVVRVSSAGKGVVDPEACEFVLETDLIGGLPRGFENNTVSPVKGVPRASVKR